MRAPLSLLALCAALLLATGEITNRIGRPIPLCRGHVRSMCTCVPL